MKTQTAKTTKQDLATHKFDTSKYVVLATGVRRDAASGRLVAVKKPPSKR